MKPRVSVILTTYNRPELLETAIDSVLEQEFQDFELLIMDDNSDMPRQKEILLKYWNTPKVIIYKSNIDAKNRRKTARYATMVNEAFKLIRGEFVTYICDDDFYYQDRLQRMVEYLDNNPDVSVVYGQQRISKVDPDGNEIASSIREASRVLENANCLVDHSSVMHRTSCIEKVGEWDDSPEWWGGADGQYWEKLGLAGFHFYPIPTVLDCHVGHDGSWTKDANWKKLGTKEEPK